MKTICKIIGIAYICYIFVKYGIWSFLRLVFFGHASARKVWDRFDSFYVDFDRKNSEME